MSFCNCAPYFIYSLFLQDISVKTKEILANLFALADEGENSKITLEGLKQRHFPPATENFLFHLAAAEQLLRI